jgi:hypothetical protein
LPLNLGVTNATPNDECYTKQQQPSSSAHGWMADIPDDWKIALGESGITHREVKENTKVVETIMTQHQNQTYTRPLSIALNEVNMKDMKRKSTRKSICSPASPNFNKTDTSSSTRPLLTLPDIPSIEEEITSTLTEPTTPRIASGRSSTSNLSTTNSRRSASLERRRLEKQKLPSVANSVINTFHLGKLRKLIVRQRCYLYIR